MAFNNLSNEKVTQILLILTLTLSGYSTLTNTHLDTSISNELKEKLDAIITLREEINDKIDQALYDINSKINENSADIKIIESRVAEIEKSNYIIVQKIESIQDRLSRVESKVIP